MSNSSKDVSAFASDVEKDEYGLDNGGVFIKNFTCEIIRKYACISPDSLSTVDVNYACFNKDNNNTSI